ncbi:hypothetical protein [Catenovulum adriaticum]|uniref:Transposase n=1 Tax=Catenovulum adriaticum TaxID=2984846 RepID=A0ABY7AST6_9ALTE|nr:hypothetical protein [Catenovulum sp. TS8]WAJ71351.1 hypothetical protein OLW01_06020 [Catenovulum sp. TS8]
MKRRLNTGAAGRRKNMLKKIHTKVINRRKFFANMQMEDNAL